MKIEIVYYIALLAGLSILTKILQRYGFQLQLLSSFIRPGIPLRCLYSLGCPISICISMLG